MRYSHLKHDKFFQLGLFLKVTAILFLVPIIQENWFVPFLSYTIENPTIDPWYAYKFSSGAPIFFPYGITMLLAHLPTTALGLIIDNYFGTEYFLSFGFRFSLLIADIVCLIALCEMTNANHKTIIKLYWLSPVTFFIIYWHGQTDIIPVALFFVGAVFAFRGALIKSAIFLAVALVAKHSAAMAIPFILLYFVMNKRGSYEDIIKFIVVFIVTVLLLEGSFAFSSTYQSMVLFNPEVAKLFWLSLDMGAGILIPLTPVFFVAFLYMIWHLKRCNSHLIIIAIGVGINIVLLMVPARPGWYLWLVPILAIYAATNRKNNNILTWLWAASFAMYHLIYSDGSHIMGTNFNPLTTQFPMLNEIKIQNYLYSINFTLLLLLTIQLVRDGVFANDYFKLSKKALVIGIGGDSGTGKSTMSMLLADVFGYNSVDRKSVV